MNTKDKIIGLIKQNQKIRVEDIRHQLNLSRAIIHRHLNTLRKQNLITKSGKPPLVFYLPSQEAPSIQKTTNIQPKIKKYIDQNYLYISPVGQIINGFNGFRQWVKNINQEKYLTQLSQEYVQTKKSANQSFNSLHLINATKKIKATFPKTYLKQTYYADFYSLPKFGKTILGQKVLYAKQSQSNQLIKAISKTTSPLIKRVIKKHNIQAVAFIPPTIPRKIQFQKEFNQQLNIHLPHISLVKAYPGDIPVAQKTLAKLEQRVKNAQETIFTKDQNINYKNILLIDDAVGSGASLNQTAKKLKEIHHAKNIYGFAVVGSFKGFDVLQEI